MVDLMGLISLKMNLEAIGIQLPSPDFVIKYCNIIYTNIVQHVLQHYAKNPGNAFGNPLYDAWKKIFNIHTALNISADDPKFLFLCRVSDPSVNYWSTIIGVMSHYLGVCSDRAVIDNVSWAVPNEEVLEYMLQTCREQKRDLVEIGSGRGYWLRLLRDRANGTSILGYDPHALGSEESFTTVSKDDHHYAMRNHPEANILLCWPPQRTHEGGQLSADVAKRCKSDLFYVGEPVCHNPYSGQMVCMSTATVEFFGILADEWELVRKIDLPKWSTMCDDFFHYRRKDSR